VYSAPETLFDESFDGIAKRLTCYGSEGDNMSHPRTVYIIGPCIGQYDP